MINRLIILTLSVLIVSAPMTAEAQESASKSGSAVSYGFVVDNSGSYRQLLDRVITLVRAVAEKNSSGDEAFLVTFVDTSKIVVRQEITSEISEIIEAAENMFIQGGPTAILDAVRLSLEHLSANAKDEPGRTRALLLITDGDEHSSQAKIETVIALAKDAKIKIVVVGMSDEKLNTKLLDRLAKETGGTTFYPKTAKEMTQAIDNISSAIRRN
jgi:Mg-chelatase subunit ChlD